MLYNITPPQPKTRPNLDKVHHYEKALDIDGMIARALSGLKIEEITPNATKKEAEFADLL